MQLPFQWLLGHLSLKAKRPKRDAGQLPAPNSEDKNAHSIVRFQWIVLEHREKFNSTFLLLLCSIGPKIGQCLELRYEGAEGQFMAIYSDK